MLVSNYENKKSFLLTLNAFVWLEQKEKFPKQATSECWVVNVECRMLFGPILFKMSILVTNNPLRFV